MLVRYGLTTSSPRPRFSLKGFQHIAAERRRSSQVPLADWHLYGKIRKICGRWYEILALYSKIQQGSLNEHHENGSGVLVPIASGHLTP